MSEIQIGNVSIPCRYLNRHGLIAGATGSGKTQTIKYLLHALYKEGISALVTDIKGDMLSIIDDDETFNTQIRYWDVFGENGLPIRTTLSGFGVYEFAKYLGLNTTQTGCLFIIFAYAQENDLAINNIYDLQKIMQLMLSYRKEISETYGLISSTSMGAIQRALLELKMDGGEKLFGCDCFNIEHFIDGKIQILDAVKLYEHPTLYAAFLIFLLGKICKELPEVGDLEKPKLVLFFDEAHLMFYDMPKQLREKVLKTIRLIRSKGVGIFFATQGIKDIPNDIQAQLTTKIIHKLNLSTSADKRVCDVLVSSYHGGVQSEDIVNQSVGCCYITTLTQDSEQTALLPVHVPEVLHTKKTESILFLGRAWEEIVEPTIWKEYQSTINVSIRVREELLKEQETQYRKKKREGDRKQLFENICFWGYKILMSSLTCVIWITGIFLLMLCGCNKKRR